MIRNPQSIFESRLESLEILSNNGIVDNEVGATTCQNSFGIGECGFAKLG
jgi:hypothetical protein